jgi:hypothetical protein
MTSSMTGEMLMLDIEVELPGLDPTDPAPG